MKRPRIWITLAVLFALLVAARLALPSLALRKLNNTLATLDGPFYGHIENVRLALIQSKYVAEGVTVSRWAPDHSRCEASVLRIESLHISLAWLQLLHGRLRMKADARFPVVFADPLIAALKEHKTGDIRRDTGQGADEAFRAVVPWRIDSFNLSGGAVHFRLLGTNDSAVTLQNAEGVITGIEEGKQLARPVFFRLRGDIFRSARLLVTGKLDLGASPTLWKVDYSAEHLELKDANRLLLNRVPITFTKGKMDLYGEAAGGGPVLDGYAKLLFQNIRVVGKRERWKSFKHGVVEIVSSLFFIAAKNPELKTAGTTINFGMKDGKFTVDEAGAVTRALAHRSGERVIKPGIENRLALPNRHGLPARAASPSEGL
ncbi:MAG: hypothetical protein ACXWSD_19585 [Bdellovibrionota bacterium]